MNNKIKLLHGYLILILSLFMFTMWGINLVSLSKIEVDTPHIEGKPKNSSAANNTIRTVKVKPRPFVYFYLRELGYDTKLISDIPQENSLLIISEPMTKMKISRRKQLFRWIKDGGNLLLLSSGNNILARLTGADIKVSDFEWNDNLEETPSWFKDASEITLSNEYIKPKRGASFFSHLNGEKKGALTTYRGNGQITIIASRELYTPAGLVKSDNVIYLTRLIDFMTKNKKVYVYDPNLTATVFARVRGNGGNLKIKFKKKKIDYLSLWSLIKANPISIVLLQLIFGLILFIYSVSRVFRRSLPIEDFKEESQGFIENMGRLFHKKSASDFAARKLKHSFIVSLRKKYGFSNDVTDKEILERIDMENSEIKSMTEKLLTGLNRLKNKQGDEEMLFRYSLILDKIRKELHIHE